MEEVERMETEDAAGAPVAEPTESPETREGEDSEPKRPAVASYELALRDERLRPLVGLELPVYTSRLDKMLETVGGLDTLQRTHEAKSQFLPVKLRPTEPSCKPLFADLTKTQQILLRVTRTTRRKKRRRQAAVLDEATETEHQSESAPTLQAEAVGLVREKYVCEGMADFQYLTARCFFPTPEPEAAVDGDVMDTDVTDEKLLQASQDATSGPICKPSVRQRVLQRSLRPYLEVSSESQLELIPEVFSKVDLPLKYEFRQRSGYQPTASAKKPSSTMTYLNFHDATAAPAGPKPEQPVVRRRPVGASDDGLDEHVLGILQRKLDLKPIWLRAKLFEGLDALERRAARRLLRKLCYVFVDGPWRGSWVRMGYDPRVPAVAEQAAQLQVVELRNNRELVHAKVTHASRKRTKKFVGVMSVGSGSGATDGTPHHVKGPRIVKVTQTSALENAQVNKRRRKERFTRGETRRSYLVEPTTGSAGANGGDAGAGATTLSPRRSLEPSNGDDWDSDEQEDKEPAPVEAAAVAATEAAGEKTFEIFGVPLASANVLFQLEEIDDEEVAAWTAQFAKQQTPSLLGGWYPTQMFLPLREMIRLRIAALVGRSKAELETRRKRLDALKKQALSDYADEQASAGKTLGESPKASDGDGKQTGGTAGAAALAGDKAAAEAVVAAEEDELAFERSLLREQRAEGRVAKLSTRDEEEEEEEEEEEDLDLEEDEEKDPEQDTGVGAGAASAAYEEGEDEDEEESDEDKQEKATEQPQASRRRHAPTKSTEYSF